MPRLLTPGLPLVRPQQVPSLQCRAVHHGRRSPSSRRPRITHLQVGWCHETETPWEPAVGPRTEEEAGWRARRILQEWAGSVTASPGSDKENKAALGVNRDGGADKTYLVQKVLSFNKEEVKEEVASEVKEAEAARPQWDRCLTSGEDCLVNSTVLPRPPPTSSTC